MTRIALLLALTTTILGCTSPVTRYDKPSLDESHAAPLAATPKNKIISAAELPVGYVLVNHMSALYLKFAVSDQRIVTVAPSSSADANFSARFVDKKQEFTILGLHSKLEQTVKFDMYTSPDGARYLYTSSCPVLAGKSDYENWPEQYIIVALTNPRVITNTQTITCD